MYVPDNTYNFFHPRARDGVLSKSPHQQQHFYIDVEEEELEKIDFCTIDFVKRCGSRGVFNRKPMELKF